MVFEENQTKNRSPSFKDSKILLESTKNINNNSIELKSHKGGIVLNSNQNVNNKLEIGSYKICVKSSDNAIISEQNFNIFVDSSLKANLSIDGGHKLKNWCSENDLPILKCGKLLINNCENCSLNYNPEFIAQGDIINGFRNPDIILIGTEDDTLGNKLEEIYKNIAETNPRYCVLTPIEAEMVKISINGFITTKLSFANMISDVCDKLGADKNKVLKSVGGDSRIGNKYFNPGYSFGGPCFPRDTKALKQIVNSVSINSDLLVATTKYNEEHSMFQTNQLLEQGKEEYIIEDICFKEGSKIPIIEESAKLKIARNLVKAGKKVIIKDESHMIGEVIKEYGNLFEYELK